MEYSKEQVEAILLENGGQLPPDFVKGLETALKNRRGISMPILEENGRLKMIHLTDFQYHFLSLEGEENQRRYEAEIKEKEYQNSREFKAKWEKENAEFWRRYAIRARIIALRQHQKETQDPRTKLLWDIEKRGREEYVKTARLEGREFDSADIEIAGAETVFSYIEANHLDLYGYVQRCMRWWDKETSQK